jgi:hypothetical protein
VLIVLWCNESEIIYAHSSEKTETKGVHLGSIRIINPNSTLQNQDWKEKTAKGDNFGSGYFNPSDGDCVVRLKIFS